MFIPQKFFQFNDERAVVVVAAKEKGIIYLVSSGVLKSISVIDEPHSTYSDREGFFFRSGYGGHYHSGAPYEENEDDLRRFADRVSQELSSVIARYAPEVVYLFHPAHYRGYLRRGLRNPSHIPLVLVKEGNFVQHPPQTLLQLLTEYRNNESDPRNPESVAEGKNAEEKRKLLRVGR